MARYNTKDYQEATLEDAKEWMDEKEKWLFCEDWLWFDDMPMIEHRAPYIEELEERFDKLLRRF